MKKLILLLLLFISCNPFLKQGNFQARLEPVYIDKSFLKHEIIEIRRCLDCWQDATNGTVTFSEQEKYDTTYLFISKNHSLSSKVLNIEFKTKHGINGHYYNNEIIIVYDKGLIYQTCLHEIGHFLGLDHNNNYSIMNPSFTYELNKPTQNDLNSLAEILK